MVLIKYMRTNADTLIRRLTGAFLSMGLMTNFLSLKEMLRISLQGKPIFGVSLRKGTKKIEMLIKFHLNKYEN